MTVITADARPAVVSRPRSPIRPARRSAWMTLTGRRLALSARTPREVLAPLTTPILFA